ncbi:MAG: 2'-5' RNA ligase family protein [Chloroflexi bacterium]|nr:2'-5' RNA ligase family protein [Chloroflexota bacterium]
MKQRFGVGSPQATGVPHITYHIAPTYDLKTLKQILQETAVSTPPFTVKTSGIAVFTSEKLVVYIPVISTQKLITLHTVLWSRLQTIAQDSHNYFAPSNWLPHISLAHGDITPENIGAIVTWLTSQPLSWDIQVDNLTLIHDDEQHVPFHRVPLQG